MSDPPQLRLNDECLDSRHVGSVQHFSVGYPVFPRDTHDLAQASEVKLVERLQLLPVESPCLAAIKQGCHDYSPVHCHLVGNLMPRSLHTRVHSRPKDAPAFASLFDTSLSILPVEVNVLPR